MNANAPKPYVFLDLPRIPVRERVLTGAIGFVCWVWFGWRQVPSEARITGAFVLAAFVVGILVGNGMLVRDTGPGFVNLRLAATAMETK